VRASTGGLVGKPTIHMVWRVPAEDEATIDKYWKTHEEFMKKTHVVGEFGEASSAPRALEFYIAKGKELNDPMDPEKGESGNLLYIMSEIYVAPEDVAGHMKVAGEEWEGMAQMGDYMAKYNVAAQIGTCGVFTCLTDESKAFDIKRGEPTIQVIWRVPASDEKEVDAFWKSHEAFMRKTHVMGKDGADKVHLTSFSINKGKELNDPMDPEQGETGNFLYVMSESYVAPEDVAGHMATAESTWSEFSKFPDFMEKYAIFAQVGAASVFTTF